MLHILLVLLSDNRSSISRLSVNDKSILVKDKDATLERQSLGQLIMEEDTSPIDKVPKVELTIETERGRKCNISEENGNFL